MFEHIPITRNWQDLPVAVCRVLEKWQKIADEEKKQYKMMWPAKLVHTDFTYDGQNFRIVPETFGVEEDLMECFQQEPLVEGKYGTSLTKDLWSIGCSYVFSDGFMD